MRKRAFLLAIFAAILLTGCGEKREKENIQKNSVKVKKEVKKELKTKKESQDMPPLPPPLPAAKSDKSSVSSAKLYAKCAGCHGNRGEKKALGKSAPIGGMDRAKLVELIKGYRNGTLNSYGMGTLMKNQVKSLNDKEIEALSEYISKLK